jgi:hypothetical protein
MNEGNSLNELHCSSSPCAIHALGLAVALGVVVCRPFRSFLHHIETLTMVSMRAISTPLSIHARGILGKKFLGKEKGFTPRRSFTVQAGTSKEIITEGTGPSPNAGDAVTMHYTYALCSDD